MDSLGFSKTIERKILVENEAIYYELCTILNKERVLNNPSEMIEWGKDWTNGYESNPSFVVFPKTTEEISTLLKFCNENMISVVPSGGRTGLAAGAVAENKELVLSLDKMSKILELDAAAMTLELEAGAITEAVQNYAHEHELMFPIDLASKGSCQIGGNIATNAGGLKFIRYGGMRHVVLGLEVVLASGEVLNLNTKLRKNNAGYDLKQLFIGSEGTLGVISKATLALAKKPGDLNLCLLGAQSMACLVKIMTLLNKKIFTLSAFEFFTDKALKKVQEHFTELKKNFLTEESAYYALVEIESSLPDIKEKMEQLLVELFEQELISDAFIAHSSEEFKKLWALRENITECLAIESHVKKNDITLTADKMEEFINFLEEKIFPQLKQVQIYLFGHLGDGNIHINYHSPNKVSREDFIKELEPIEYEVLKKIIDLKGSISAEHGIGLLKKDLLQKSCSQNELDFMKSIKKIFDPNGIMNPGKIF